MAASPLRLRKISGARWEVVLRSTGQTVAHLYLQSNKDGYRFRLVNYSHRLSKLYPDKGAALSAIESEVL